MRPGRLESRGRPSGHRDDCLMPHRFREAGCCRIGGADPLVCAGRPRPALCLKNQALATVGRPTRGSAADQGVRPTIYADARKWENYAALGTIAPPLSTPFRKYRFVFRRSKCNRSLTVAALYAASFRAATIRERCSRICWRTYEMEYLASQGFRLTPAACSNPSLPARDGARRCLSPGTPRPPRCW